MSAARFIGAMALATACFASQARAAERIDVVVPDPDNLQFLVFWVSQGAGLFESEDLAVYAHSPPYPRGAIDEVASGTTRVAILPPPMCLELIASGTPLLVVANLLANDPIDLVVSAKIAHERKISANRALADRLRSLHGLRIGVAPNPPTRLRALFASVGLDADRDIEMVILRGEEQNQAFESGEVDALYAHTPYLENALVDQGAVLVVNQSAGEVPELSHRQIHTLAVSRSFAAERPNTVTRLVRALSKGAKLVRSDPHRAVDALLRTFPEANRRKLEVITDLYRPAVPTSLAVSADELPRSAALFPAMRTKPKLDGLDLAGSVDNRFVVEAEAASAAASRGSNAVRRRNWAPAVGIAILCTVFGIVLFFRARSRRHAKRQEHDSASRR